jgi:glycosyltransferase involved in cell wall biosynthesis
MKSKILIITGKFPPDIGGVASVGYDYACNLASLGHEVTVVTREFPDTPNPKDFIILQVPNKFGRRLWLFNYSCFLRKFSAEEFDQIILNGTLMPVVAGKYLKKDVLSKCVIIIQGLEIETVYENNNAIIKKFFYTLLRIRYYHKRAIMNCRKVVSVSDAYRNKFIIRSNLKKYDIKFQTIHTGIDRSIFYFIDSDFKSGMGFTDEDQIILTVSRIEKMKGFLSMLAIMEKLVKKNKPYKWIIIGDGPFYKELKEIVLQRNLAGSVFLLGQVERKKLNYYYSASDCFMLLSDYDECFGLVYLEAQSCGIPAVGRRKGGVVETIVHNKTGFLVNDDEECFNILLNKTYKNISKKDIEVFVKKFDKIEAAKELVK